jgi:hypothetical protein
MFDTGEVGLGRIGEQLVSIRDTVVEVARERPVGDAKVRRIQRHIFCARSLRARELADAVDRVVVVARREEPALRPERVRLADEPQRARGVRREDADVLPRGSVEPAQHGGAGPVHERGRRRRGRVDGVRVAVDAVPHDPQMLLELRLCVEAAAGVVEIDVAAGVEASVLRAAKLVEDRGSAEGRMRVAEHGLRLGQCRRVEGLRGGEGSDGGHQALTASGAGSHSPRTHTANAGSLAPQPLRTSRA